MTENEKQKACLIGVDQSTQGTKAMLFDSEGNAVGREDVSHRQIIDENGWISHDPEEIYRNVIRAVGGLLKKTGIDRRFVKAVGISNQRETAMAWDRESGKPVCPAIVWQCARGREICDRLEENGVGELVKKETGMPLSPYFSAAKLAWIMEKTDGVRERAEKGEICCGTMDTWLLYRLTEKKVFRTDYSNASRTQLFSIESGGWDERLCRLFGVSMRCLPEVCDSDRQFGETDMGGLLPGKVPIHGVMGDSNSALFGHGCLEKGMMKVTYGTGSSVMMNTGETPFFSEKGLATSLAWKIGGKVSYVLEGNINYTGAIVTWMKENLGLIRSADEAEELAKKADRTDRTYLIPAFSGLGAPYWKSDATAMFCGMNRKTGKAELVRAGLESIAYQVADVVQLMEKESLLQPIRFCVDGGPTRNGWLMQFQSNILNRTLELPEREEMSCLGAAYLAGLGAGVYREGALFGRKPQKIYQPASQRREFQLKYATWKRVIETIG